MNVPRRLYRRLHHEWSRVRNLRLYDQRQFHQLWEQHHLRQLLTRFQVDCVFDVGANEGQYATMLRREVGYDGLIVSFEPDPAVARTLRERAARDDRWLVEEVAISDVDGERDFHVMALSVFSSLGLPNHGEVDIFRDQNRITTVVRVRTERLQTAYARLQKSLGFRRPFLKLDTQGHDVTIVRSATDVLPKFIGLQSELSIKRIYDSSVDYREAIALYESCGFDLSAFVPNNEGHFPHLVETDCIMLRKSLLDA